MTNYLLLYTPGRVPQSEEEGAAVMQAWTNWFKDLGSSVIDAGNPTSQAKTIASDGTVSDDSDLGKIGGYSVIKADSLDEAVAKAKGCPVTQAGGKVIVLETFEIQM
jgi:hypothetical protein